MVSWVYQESGDGRHLLMGAFYVNTTVYGPAQGELAAALSDRVAFVSPTVRRCTLILDEACESQSQEEIISFSAVLSYRFRCPVLSVGVHDDDALFYWLHREGRFIDLYLSNPSAFVSPGGLVLESVGGNADVLAESFGVAVTPRLRAALRTSHGFDSKFVTETARHQDLVAALELPPFSVGLGYGYFQRGDVPGVSTSNFLATAQAQG